MSQWSTPHPDILPPIAEKKSWIAGICTHLQDGVRSLNPQTLDLIYVNPAAEDLYQQSWRELQQHPQAYLHYIVPQDRDRVLQTLEAAQRTQGGELEYSIILPNGDTQVIRDRYWLTTDSQGNPLSLDSLLTPLAERQNPYNATETSSLQSVSQNLPGTIYQYLLRPE
ncbi:MAG: PAS domain-containing protein, partial [Kamptonema sp. SIO4C4]|nr:PAS domain-containing protein [Kamptonema sp. SIO4C4]